MPDQKPELIAESVAGWDPAASYWCPNCGMAVKVHNDAELKRCKRLTDQKPGRKSHHATSDRAFAGNNSE